ncbi:MAG: hexokinase [Acidobacteriota bacterium]
MKDISRAAKAEISNADGSDRRLASELGDLELSPPQLADIARALADQVRAGLASDGQEIRCLPAFLPTLSDDSIPETAYVVDVGGSNVRAAVVSSRGDRPALVAGPVDRPLPRGVEGTLAEQVFFGVQREALEALGHDAELPLGYCFSYPAEPTPDGDARLLKWTKEIDVPELVGEKVGSRLLRHLRDQHSTVRCSRVAVVNDTVASLLSGLSRPGYDAYVGLVVGTGFNLASFFDAGQVPKLTASSGRIPVNLESGNFSPPWLTRWDEALDAESQDQGQQRFEKAVSGAYLGTLAEKVLGTPGFSNAAALAQVLSNPHVHPPGHVEVAWLIFRRSAGLVAAGLAGLASVLQDPRPTHSIRVTAEGGLFWSRVAGRSLFAETTLSVLAELQEELKLPQALRFDCGLEDHANLFGAAVAALYGRR